MSDHAANDLQYGHIGICDYDPVRKQWHFGRQPELTGHLRLLQESSVIIPSLLEQEHEKPISANHKTRFSTRLNHLTDTIPEAAAVQSSSLNLLESSSNSAGRSQEDPTHRGNLLAFGDIRAFDARGGESWVEVYALATGRSRHVLRVSRTEIIQSGWDQVGEVDKGQTKREKRVGIGLPDLTSGDTVCWDFNGDRLEQICFARSSAFYGTTSQKGSFLAARTRTRITIFFPRYLSLSVSTRNRVMATSECRPSRISLNPIISLSTARSHGGPYADMTFNPENYMQFATVSRCGSWYIWDIVRKGPRGIRSTYEAVLQRSGSLIANTSEQTNDSAAKILGDGRSQIEWLKDGNAVVVCCRQKSVLLHQTSPLVFFSSTDISLPGDAGWCLNVQVDPLNRGHFFILTTQRLYWLALDNHNGDLLPSAHVVLSWQHFRNASDLSLQLAITPVGKDARRNENDQVTRDAKVLLYSCHDHIVTTFRLLPAQTNVPHTSSCDPGTIYSSHSRQTQSNESPGLLDMVIRPLPFFAFGDILSGLGLKYWMSGIGIYCILALREDLSLEQQILYCDDRLPPSDTASTEVVTSILPLRWRNARELRKTASTILDEVFVIRDGVGEAEDGGVAFIMPLRQYKAGLDHFSLPTAAQHEFSTARQRPFSHYSRVACKSSDRVEVDFLDHVMSLKRELEDRTLDGSQLPQTLSKPNEVEFKLADVDLASANLQELLQHGLQTKPQSNILLRRTSTTDCAQLCGITVPVDDAQVLSSLYEYGITSWVSPLARDVSGRIRLAKERQVRTVEAEICLATTLLIGVEPPTVDEEARVEENLHDDRSHVDAQFHGLSRYNDQPREAGSLPERPHNVIASQSSPNSPSPSSQGVQSLLLSPPEQSASGTVSKSPRHHGDDSDAFSRLSRYAKLSPKLSRPKETAMRITSHWQPHSSPHQYNYLAAEIASRAPRLSDITEEQREKLRKQELRQQRLEARQRREAEVFSQTVAASSQQVELTIRSSPVPQLRREAAPKSGSQLPLRMASSQAFAASQVERGVHGGSKGKKGKARKSGF